MSIQILTASEVGEIQAAANPLHAAGIYRFDEQGRLWVYLQASVVLAQGEAVERVDDVIDADVDAAAAVDTVRVTGTGDFTAAAMPNGNYSPDGTQPNGHQYFLWINDSAAQGQGGPIRNRPSDNAVDVYWIQSDDGKISTALTTSSDYIVYTHTRVKLAASANATQIIAFVQRQAGVTDENWFWGLAKGHGIGLLDTLGTALTKGLPIVAGDNAGTVQGGDASAADAYYMAGYGIIDSDADAKIPIVADCRRIPGIVVPGILTAAYPAMR